MIVPHRVIELGYNGIMLESLERDMEKAKTLGNTNLGREYIEKVRRGLETLQPALEEELEKSGRSKELLKYSIRADELSLEVITSDKINTP
jgi:hypothetical protein